MVLPPSLSSFSEGLYVNYVRGSLAFPLLRAHPGFGVSAGWTGYRPTGARCWTGLGPKFRYCDQARRSLLEIETS